MLKSAITIACVFMLLCGGCASAQESTQNDDHQFDRTQFNTTMKAKIMDQHYGAEVYLTGDDFSPRERFNIQAMELELDSIEVFRVLEVIMSHPEPDCYAARFDGAIVSDEQVIWDVFEASGGFEGDLSSSQQDDLALLANTLQRSEPRCESIGHVELHNSEDIWTLSYHTRRFDYRAEDIYANTVTFHADGTLNIERNLTD